MYENITLEHSSEVPLVGTATPDIHLRVSHVFWSMPIYDGSLFENYHCEGAMLFIGDCANFCTIELIEICNL